MRNRSILCHGIMNEMLTFLELYTPLINNLILSFMYPTLIELLVFVNLCVICLYPCLVNLIWGCKVPGGTCIQIWCSIMVHG